MISREEARLILQDMFNSCIDGYTNLLAEDKKVPAMLIDDINALDMAIEALSTERPKGRWEEYGYKWKCSECGGKINLDGTPEENNIHYCPNCGAEMVRGEE